MSSEIFSVPEASDRVPMTNTPDADAPQPFAVAFPDETSITPSGSDAVSHTPVGYRPAVAEAAADTPVPVPPELKSWDVDWPDYNPPAVTTEWVLTTGVEIGASDPESPVEVDFLGRPSFVEDGYAFDERGYPLNPMGRQGVRDRGDLAKWGPNQAAEPVVVAVGRAVDAAEQPTDNDGNATGGRRLLAVRRSDTGQWALPGGMVDPGEYVSKTARRELKEETGIDLGEMDGEVIYEGYVDDPRNTDNAWMETTARLFVVEHVLDAVAGDDAVDAHWFECDSIGELEAATRRLDESLGRPVQPLYASHSQIIEAALQRLQAHPSP